ncbi:hypothetical protein M422DRAFT_45276 [Sphaerobolus stellatus SS14]|nr:hypothetical protein M422DRAFT_45276 [Sphaerobolus stellatus SS14]
MPPPRPPQIILFPSSPGSQIYPSLVVIILVQSIWLFPDPQCGNESMEWAASCHNAIWVWWAAVSHVIIICAAKRMQSAQIIHPHEITPDSDLKIELALYCLAITVFASMGPTLQMGYTFPQLHTLSLVSQARIIGFLVANILGVLTSILDLCVMLDGSNCVPARGSVQIVSPNLKQKWEPPDYEACEV